jgi:hypothetical protein
LLDAATGAAQQQRLLHASISGDDRKWETDAVDALVPAYSTTICTVRPPQKNPECFFL